jgi:precorrin-6A/cobalt-precorrin-6A reductase
MTTVLLLGGTGEARALAAALDGDRRLRVISSLAGRVRNPAMPAGEVVTGGFGGAAGLAAYLGAQQVGRVIDATHPYATTISRNAVRACAEAAVPLLVLQRPGWEAAPGDRWARVPTLQDAAEQVRALTGPAACVLVTTGRRELGPFRDDHDRTYVIRAVDRPEVPLPPNHVVILDRGPYTVDGELALIDRHQVAAIVTKDSGGPLTVAKLHAARLRGIPVIVVDRPPPESSSTPRVSTVDAAIRWLN